MGNIRILGGGASYDPSTSDVVLDDRQLFYSKFNKKLYIGDGVKKLSELKPIGQEYWDEFNIENGTNDVLIQTKDLNHSFKVMTDGAVKVHEEPVEADDVLRLNELSVLTQSQVDLLF